MFKDIRSLESELDTIAYLDVNDPVGSAQDKSERLRGWDSRFFNTLEWLAFLINKGQVKDSSLKGFFKDSIIGWYEKLFLTHMKQAVDNDKEFPELKKLYQVFKVCQARGDSAHL